MSKLIQDFLPPKRIRSKDRVVVQGRIPAEIEKQARRIIEKHDLKWRDVLAACLEKFIEEMDQKK